jgi:electron transport complex protein RnfC
MAATIRAGKLDKAEEFGVKDCISCGSCSYVCPANIPLVHFFNYAKGELAARHKSHQQQTYTAGLAKQRKERMAEVERKRAELAAQAAAAKKRRAEAAKKAAEGESGDKAATETAAQETAKAENGSKEASLCE